MKATTPLGQNAVALIVVGAVVIVGIVIVAIVVLSTPSLWFSSRSVRTLQQHQQEFAAAAPRMEVADASVTPWPTVSAIIPSYQRPHTLERAVRSAAKQRETYPGTVEIVVVEDASGPRFSAAYDAVFASLADVSGLLVERRVHNAGQSSARNRGMVLASGEYVAFLDDDDVWLPRKLEVQVRAMRGTPGCVLSSTDAFRVRFDEGGGGVPDPPAFPVVGKTGNTCTPVVSMHFGRNGLPTRFTAAHIRRFNCLVTSSVVVSRELLLSLRGGFDVDLHTAEDRDMWIRALGASGEPGLSIRVPLLMYDLGHAGNAEAYRDSAKKRSAAASRSRSSGCSSCG